MNEKGRIDKRGTSHAGAIPPQEDLRQRKGMVSKPMPFCYFKK